MITLLAAFLAVSMSLSGAEKSQEPIPGIDPITSASDDRPVKLPIQKFNLIDGAKKLMEEKKAHNQATGVRPQTQANGSKNSDPSSELNQRVITNIRVVKHPVQEHSVAISWDVDPANKYEIYVGRYSQQLNTKKAVFEAENLTSPPLGPQVSRYSDVNLPNGNYYYVVVTRNEMRQNGKLLTLVSDQNYTSKPFVVSRKKEVATQKHTPPTPKEETKKTEQPDSSLPQITNLRVRPDHTKKGAAKISWRYKGAPSSVYIVRHIRPISNEDILYAATMVTKSPLSSSTTNFVDTDIPRGTYYYAAYTEREAEKTIKLKPKANYTTRPFINRHEDTPAPEPKKDTPPDKQDLSLKVLNLNAQNLSNSVKLSWSPVAARSVIYKIYRSQRPLNEYAPDSSNLIGNAMESTPNFEDFRPLPDKPVYYAVTATTLSNNFENKEFVLNRSMIRHTFSKAQPGQSEKHGQEPLPDALIPVLQNKNTVKVYWKLPTGINRGGYNLYRHSRPISSENQINNASFVARIKPGVDNHVDSELKPGSYFYGLFPLNSSGQEIKVFVENQTFTGNAIRIKDVKPDGEQSKTPKEPTPEQPDKEESPEPILHSFKGDVIKNSINLSWRADLKDRSDVTLQLFRSNSPLRNFNELEKNGILIEEFTGKYNRYRDTDLANGRYYYALIFMIKNKPSTRMLEGKNFLKKPLRVNQSEKKEEPEDKTPQPEATEQPEKPAVDEEQLLNSLNKIIKKFYSTGKYGEAIRRMAPFVSNKDYPDAIRARAMLYTGISYHHLGLHDSAIEFFLINKVQKYYSERSRFWYNRSLEKLR